MTVVADIPSALQDQLFTVPGTTAAGTSWPPTKQFIGSLLMAGAVMTGTLTVVTPVDAFAMQAATVESRTLPALPASLPDHERTNEVAAVLRRLRRVSGLNWGDVAAALGVSRRTIHNWLSGARVAGIHFTRLMELERIVNSVAVGSADKTRARLAQPGPHGRSLLDEMALRSQPARRRPLSAFTVGDLVGPTSGETEKPSEPKRPSSLRGRALQKRQPPE
jgi:transcriptional regulator with XRE-family HTH domain